MLTEGDNRKSKKTPILRKDPIFHKNETKIEDQKISNQSRLHFDCKEVIPGNKYFPDDFSQSSNHELNKNYRYDGEVAKMLCKLIQQQSAPDYFMEVFKKVVEKKIDGPGGRLTRLIKYTTGEANNLIKYCIEQPSAEGYKNAME